MVWIPFDADETEQQELQVIREPIPDTMRPAVSSWLRGILNTGNQYGYTSVSTVNSIQSALRVSLDVDQSDPLASTIVKAIEARGDKFVLRVVDFLLSGQERELYSDDDPDAVRELRWHLDASLSAVAITAEAGTYRLEHRLPEGVEEATQLSVDASNATAGAHLAKALREMQGLEPDTAKVMTEGIRAVEAAAGAVVTPKDRKPTMGKIVGRLRDKKDWSLTLQRRDDGHPDHQAVVLGMLETLTFAEQHRHSGEPPSQTEAQAHALLAATLVGWFSTGAVVMAAK